jgi:serine/threonine-protein kinase RsbW
VSEDTTSSATRTAATTKARDAAAAEAHDPADDHEARASGASHPVAATQARTVPGAEGERRETQDQVIVRLPAEGAYLSVLRTATAGLAARLDFTLDEIEDLRIAVDEACAMLLSQAVPGASLECAFTLGHDVMTIAVTAACLEPQPPASDTFAWTVLTALAGNVDAHVGPGDLLTIVLRKTRESSGSV